MAAPDIKGEFSGVAGMLMNLIMLFIPGGNSGGLNLMDIFKRIFGFGDSNASATSPTPSPSATTTASPAATPVPTPTPQAATSNGKFTAYVLGDSLGVEVAEGGGLSGKFSSVVNEAKVGRHLSEITPAQIASVAPGSTCYISIGTNDVDGKRAWTQADANAYVQRVMKTAGDVKARGANVVIVGMQPPSADYNGNKKEVWDANIIMVNKAMDAAAKNQGIGFKSFEDFGNHAADGVHVTADGATKMGQILAASSNGPVNA